MAVEVSDVKKNYLQKVEDVEVDYTDDLDEEYGKKKGCCGRCLDHKATKCCLKFAFSNAGLCILVLGYTVGGAFLFMALEGSDEKSAKTATREAAVAIEAERAALGERIIRECLDRRHDNRTDVVPDLAQWLDAYQAQVAAAIADGYDGTVHQEEEEKYDWDIASTILFTASILTTIGYGHISPDTQLGQLVTVVYSVFALPLVSMFLVNIGAGIADIVRFVWNRGCCYLCWKRRLQAHGEWPPKDKKAKKSDVMGGLDGDDAASDRTKSAKSAFSEGSAASGHQVLLKDAPEPPPVVHPEEEEEEDAPEAVPTSLTLFIVVVYLTLGTIVFSVWSSPGDQWSMINSLYFSFVTLSTIGFGDFVPGLSDINTLSGQMRIVFAALYIIVGLAVLAMGIDLGDGRGGGEGPQGQGEARAPAPGRRRRQAPPGRAPAPPRPAQRPTPRRHHPTRHRLLGLLSSLTLTPSSFFTHLFKSISSPHDTSSYNPLSKHPTSGIIVGPSRLVPCCGIRFVPTHPTACSLRHSCLFSR